MDVIPQIDTVDRQIVHVLQLHPRAPFNTIAAVVGVSDQTAARRFQKLKDTIALRVLGAVDGPSVGWVDWYLRLQCTPGTAMAIAQALADRNDTRWVSLASAGTEIICMVQARSDETRDALFLRGLPGSRHVVQITAHSLLHVFSGAVWTGLTNALSDDQIALLGQFSGDLEPADPERGPAGSRSEGSRQVSTLRSEDQLLLDHLAHDGRASVAALALAMSWNESTVRRRMAELTRAGILYFDVDLDSQAYGYHRTTALWLTVEPSEVDAVGRAIADHPEVPFVAATTGPTNIMASVLCRDTNHFYDYLTQRLRSLAGIRSVETAPVIRNLKRAGALKPPTLKPPTLKPPTLKPPNLKPAK